jgi:hypothetical protein
MRVELFERKRFAAACRAGQRRWQRKARHLFPLAGPHFDVDAVPLVALKIGGVAAALQAEFSEQLGSGMDD